MPPRHTVPPSPGPSRHQLLPVMGPIFDCFPHFGLHVRGCACLKKSHGRGDKEVLDRR